MAKKTNNSQYFHLGFTLIEILVALAVITIALTAIIGVATQNLSNAARLNDKTLAHWVALNKIAELQIEAVLPSAGEKTGEIDMANIEWSWKVKTSKPPTYEGVMRLDVEVSRAETEDKPLTHLITLIGDAG